MFLIHNNNMEKKIVFIIGASSGIGYEIAKQLVAKNYIVYNGSRNKCEIAGVINHTVDVTNPHTIKNAFEKIIKAHGNIDVFIYSAGFSMAAPFEVTEEKDYRYLFEVNFFGLVKTLEYVIPKMRDQQHGQIVGISSMGGILPIVFDPFYSASKAAMNMLLRELSIELDPYGIKVTSIMPGGTATEFTRKRKIYDTKKIKCYDDKLTKAIAALAETEQGGMTAMDVASEIVKVIEKQQSTPLIPIGTMNKVYSFGFKVLPQPLISYFNKIKYHQIDKR